MTTPSRLRRLLLIAAALIGCVALTACQTGGATGGGSGSASSSTVIGLTYIPNIQFAPFYVADHDKMYSSDVTVSLRHHGASESLFAALASGEEQFVVAGGDEVLQARAQGVDLVAVASYYDQYPSRFIVPKDSGITTVADLKGHTIGIPGKFGENWFALLVGLEQAGLSESDVTIAEIGYTQQAALMTNKVDAVVGFANSDVVSFTAAGFPVDVIDPQVALVGACLATTTAYAQAHPEIVTAVVAGMRQGMTKASTDEADTLTIAADYIPSFRGEALSSAQATLPATTALFASSTGVISPPFDPEQWTTMGEIMGKVGLIPSGTDVEAAYSNEYNS